MSTDRFTEILNYLSAMSREFGEFRAETKARFDSLEAEMRASFEAVRADIRHLARKIETLNQDSLDLRASQRDLEARMDAFETKQG